MNTPWPLKTVLVLQAKVLMPVLSPECTAPDHPIQDSDLTKKSTTLYPGERLVLQRLVNHDRHAICQHGGVMTVILSVRHLTPLA